MQILYHPILKLELWHDYYMGQPELPQSLPVDYDVAAALTLIPTSDCLQTLRNLRWVPRSQPQGLTLFAEVEAVTPTDPATDYRTKVAVSRPYRLTFGLESRDRTFANFTALPLTPSRDQVFYFSNRSGNDQTYTFDDGDGGTDTANYLFLSQPLAAYTPGSQYTLGELVTHGDNTLEAITFPQAAGAAPSTDDWETLSPSQYVSVQDLIPRQGPIRTHTALVL